MTDGMSQKDLLDEVLKLSSEARLAVHRKSLKTDGSINPRAVMKAVDLLADSIDRLAQATLENQKSD